MNDQAKEVMIVSAEYTCPNCNQGTTGNPDVTCPVCGAKMNRPK